MPVKETLLEVKGRGMRYSETVAVAVANRHAWTEVRH